MSHVGDKDWVLSAADACAKSRKYWDPVTTADRINFDLTLRRLMQTIEAAAERGDRQTCFITPSLILDGSSVDPVKLARQLATKLQSLDFVVSRHGKALYIDWDLDMRAEESRCAKKEQAPKQAQGRAKKRPLSPPRAGQARGGARRRVRGGEINIA